LEEGTIGVRSREDGDLGEMREADFLSQLPK
jgi:hypothetical protein